MASEPHRSRGHPLSLAYPPAGPGALAAGLLESSHGSVIAFADSDTVWEPGALDLAVRFSRPILTSARSAGTAGHSTAT